MGIEREDTKEERKKSKGTGGGMNGIIKGHEARKHRMYRSYKALQGHKNITAQSNGKSKKETNNYILGVK